MQHFHPLWRQLNPEHKTLVSESPAASVSGNFSTAHSMTWRGTDASAASEGSGWRCKHAVHACSMRSGSERFMRRRIAEIYFRA